MLYWFVSHGPRLVNGSANGRWVTINEHWLTTVSELSLGGDYICETIIPSV